MPMHIKAPNKETELRKERSMTRKHFFLSLLMVIPFINKKLYRKAYIFNDDGSKNLKEFDDIKYADYFELVEPDGTLVENGKLFLAASNPYRHKKLDVLTVDTYQIS